jgi:hypothetical protein
MQAVLVNKGTSAMNRGRAKEKYLFFFIIASVWNYIRKLQVKSFEMSRRGAGKFFLWHDK